jgi:hypothetical protein
MPRSKRAKESAPHVPTWSHRLLCQSPVPGPFDVECLQWEVIDDNCRTVSVAAIPVTRLDDFLDGEQVRGCTRLPIRRSCSKYNNTKLNVTYECMSGKARGKFEQARHEDEAWELMLLGGKRDSVALGHGCKKDCPFSFNVKVYTLRSSVAIIKFLHPREQSADGEALPILSMGHANAEGNPIHKACTCMSSTPQKSS